MSSKVNFSGQSPQNFKILQIVFPQKRKEEKLFKKREREKTIEVLPARRWRQHRAGRPSIAARARKQGTSFLPAATARFSLLLPLHQLPGLAPGWCPQW